MAQVPSGTLTLLFSDLVGSTALGDRLGDETAQALRRAHDRLLREQFERFAGRVVKGTGDGFFVSFASASQGVECALAIQQAISAQHAEGRYHELQVRAGLHTGEPTIEGNDLFGSDVDLAKRVQEEAQGGQVVVSEVTRFLARHSPGLRFSDLGERTLKGFAEPWRLFEVRVPQDRPARHHLTPFVGRHTEIASLRRQLEAAARGQGSLVLVAGEPGVGKTRLMTELGNEARDRGFKVLSGRAYDMEGVPPYLPFTEALAPYVQNRSAEELWQELGEAAPIVAKLLPELRQPAPVQELGPVSPEAERYRLFEGVCDFLCATARDRLLLLLDDLHWADEPTLLLLEHLARRLSEVPLLVVGTYRDVEVDAQHQLTGLVTEMTRRRLGERLVMRPLGRTEATAFVEAALGRPPAHHVADVLYAHAEGNPFFIEELVRHLQEQGRDLSDPQAVVSDWALPESVRQVIGKRLARLSEEATQILTYSSVLGRDLLLPTVAAVTGQGEETLLDPLDEALAARLLQETQEGYAFAHPLIQQTLYQDLSAPRRRHSHRRVGEALERFYGPSEGPHLAELAHHFGQALPGGDAEKAIDYAIRAGEWAMSKPAYEEAASHYRQAADIARKQGLAEHLARAAQGFSSGGMVVGVVDHSVIALLEEALDTLTETDSATRAGLLATLAEQLYFSDAPDAPQRRATLSQEAVEMARRVGDPSTLAAALRSRRMALWRIQQIEDRTAVTAEMLRLAEHVGDEAMAWSGHFYGSIDLLELGDIGAAEKEIEAVTGLAEKSHNLRYLWFSALARAMLALLHGRFKEGEELAMQALAAGQRAHAPDAALTSAAQIFLLRREQGRLGELEAAFKEYVQHYPAVPGLRCGLAYVHSDAGREREARHEFERLAENDFAALPEDAYRSISLTLLAEVSAFLADARRADVLYQLLLPYAGRNVVVNQVACVGAACRSLGVLAAATHRWEEAAGHFESALEMNERMGARPWFAETQRNYAEMLLARAGPGDQAHAQSLLAEACVTAEELGMNRLRERLSALRRTCNDGPEATFGSARDTQDTRPTSPD
jgi:class 3 adenylate cyclase/tetratricopeptide (TPR) repeat protein